MVFQALVDLYFVQFHPAFGRLFVVYGELDGRPVLLRRVNDGDAPRVFPRGKIDGRRFEGVGEGLALDPGRRLAVLVDEDLLRLVRSVDQSEGHLVFVVPLRQVVREIAPAHVAPARSDLDTAACAHLVGNDHLVGIETVAAFGDEALHEAEGIVEPRLGLLADTEVHHVDAGFGRGVEFALADIFGVSLAVAGRVVPVAVAADDISALHDDGDLVTPLCGDCLLPGAVTPQQTGLSQAEPVVWRTYGAYCLS